MAPAKLSLCQDRDADELLSTNPLALLIGFVLDQQIPLEWAFSGPARLKERLGGGLDAAHIADMDPDELTRAFAERPAIHRFPGSNAKRVQELCRLLVDRYGGQADAVWMSAETGADLLRNVRQLPGFGDQKARIFVAFLAKQLAVRPPGWEEAAGPYGQPGSYLSAADIVDADSLARVREHKKEMKQAAKAKAK